MMLRWPFSALLVWTSGWLCYGLLLLGDIPALAAILWSALIGMLASAVARLRGYSTMRVAVFALGFPVSALLSGVVALPPWMWLLPLALALLFYPLHTLRDAPVFPTPLHALREGVVQPDTVPADLVVARHGEWVAWVPDAAIWPLNLSRMSPLDGGVWRWSRRSGGERAG